MQSLEQLLMAENERMADFTISTIMHVHCSLLGIPGVVTIIHEEIACSSYWQLACLEGLMVAGAVGLQLNPCKSFSSGLTETCTCVLKQFATFYDHSRARKNPRTPKTEKLLRNKPTPFVFLP